MTTKRKPDPIACELGDMVTWDSGANGNNDMKTGRVVWIMHKDDPQTPKEIADEEFACHSRLFRGSRFPPHFEWAYLVSVPFGGGKRGRKPRLYMPHPRHLQHYETRL